MSTPAPAAPGGLRRALPFVGLVLAAWALLPPYSGPELATEMRVEIADHVVPSIFMVVLSLAALVRTRKPGPERAPSSFMLLAGLGILLAGFWMVATHVPLVAQARRGEVTNAVAAYHTAPGIAVALFGLAWAALHWNDASPDG